MPMIDDDSEQTRTMSENTVAFQASPTDTVPLQSRSADRTPICPAAVSKFTAKVAEFIGNAILNLAISICLTLFTTFLCSVIYFRPYNLHPRVDSAVLVTFDLAPASDILLYDLSLNITLLNKFGWSKIRFNHLNTGLRYSDTRIGPPDDTLPSFKLKPEQGRTVSPVLRGRASNVNPAVAEAFARERQQGQFNINVRLTTTLTYKFFPHKKTYLYKYDCWLQFPPVPGNGTRAVTGDFKCGVAK